MGAEPAVDGFTVVTDDGEHAGRVDGASWSRAADWLVVRTGPWMFGRRVVVPTSVLDSIDVEQECVRLRCSHAQVDDAPEYDERPDHVAQIDARLEELFGVHAHR